jgi:uridine kinase
MVIYKLFLNLLKIDDIRLCRRILRDVKERGRAVDNILY